MRLRTLNQTKAANIWNSLYGKASAPARLILKINNQNSDCVVCTGRATAAACSPVQRQNPEECDWLQHTRVTNGAIATAKQIRG